MRWTNGDSILITSKLDLPTDDLRHLEEAFNALGKHRYGAQWPTDMAGHMRLGPKSNELSEHDVEMGRWAISALVQCVQNGWLPLVYFKGDRRTWYYSSSDGPSLFALYPRPTDDDEGQIELEGGKIYPCMVNLRDFPKLVRAKFANKRTAKRGRKRQFNEFDEALAELFSHNPPGMRASEVILSLKASFKGPWPGRATMYERINEARLNARMSGNPIPDQ